MKPFKKFTNSKLYSTDKEEMIGVIAFLLFFYLLNYLLQVFFPHSAFFDFWSEMETIMLRMGIVVFIWISAIILYRIVFPDGYRYIRDNIYHNFNSLPTEKKEKYSLILFIVIVLSVFFSFKSSAADPNEMARMLLSEQLERQLGVRETTPNRGVMVDMYLLSVKTKPPAPWCVAFVSWNLSMLCIDNPKSAWSPDYGREKDIIWTPKKGGQEPLAGDVVTFYYSTLGRIGHGGFFMKKDIDGYFVTIEGNTNGGGSRDGDGVYKKKRDKEKVYAVTRYIK